MQPTSMHPTEPQSFEVEDPTSVRPVSTMAWGKDPQSRWLAKQLLMGASLLLLGFLAGFGQSFIRESHEDCPHGLHSFASLSNEPERLERFDDINVMVEDEERPVLCDETLVEEACFILNGGEKHARGDDWTSSEVLRDVLSATPAAMSAFWEAAGLPTEHETEDGLGYWVECEALCAAVVEYGEENGVMPPTSDLACYNVGMETFCDLPMNPEDFSLPGPKPDEDLPDFHDDDIKKNITARVALIEAQAKMENRTESLVSLSPYMRAEDVEYDAWELVERVSNIFRIYPTRKPEPEEDDDNVDGVFLAEVKANSWPAGKERLHNQKAAMAKGYMSIVIRAINMKMTKDQMGKWFGREAFSSQASRKEILRVMNSVDHMISNVEPVYEGPQCSPNTYAYVYPKAYTCSRKSELKSRACTKYKGKFVFYLCALYLNRPGEMIETLVHEGSHHASSYTDDVKFQGGTAYGRSVCQRLARSDPRKAIKNADNFCYYIQDVATQVTPPKGSGSSASSASSGHVCPANSLSQAPDRDGDCGCAKGYKCFNGDDLGCPWSQSGIQGSFGYDPSVRIFRSSCTTCSCKNASPTPAPTPSAGSCFSGTVTSKPDYGGDCKCRQGLTCYNGEKKGCPWSTNTGTSYAYGSASCTTCSCKSPVSGWSPSPSSPSTGSGTRCFANTFRKKPDYSGDCRCRSGYACYAGSRRGCPWSRGSKSDTYGSASCTNCQCKSRYR